MHLRDLADANRWIGRLVYRLDRIEHGSILENASVTDGRLRFIRGLLRLDSGARLEGVGTFQWEGPGSIKGDFEVLGDGRLRVGNVLITPLGGGRIEVGTGVVIDGATGKITAGNLTIDPAMDGGAVDFGDGRRVHAGSGYLGVYDGDRFMVFNPGGVTMYADGRSISVGVGGVRFNGLPTKSASSTGKTPNDAVFDESGYLYRIV